MSEPISVEKTKNPKAKPQATALGFGQFFSDHMFTCKYQNETWEKGQVIPYQPIPIDPSASVLHYGQALFEGMKAFRQKDGKLVLFRPRYNAERIREGAKRLCMQAPPVQVILDGIKALVKTDESWVPKERGCSLYIRPTLIGTEAFLGVRPSNEYLFYVILSPVGAYYKEGLSPISIWVEEEFVRAAPGGLGATKAGANYASSLLAALNAKKQGCAQVLWLDVSHQYIEEVGTMNVFFKINDELITPSLDGTILAGGVRNSVIELLKSWNIPVVERKLSISEVKAAHDNGSLKEIFGTGTAAVISPVGELRYQGKNLLINEKKIGPVAARLHDEITGIQFGEKPDTFGWLTPL
jgi:branched-chain amino acid aminotransferase